MKIIKPLVFVCALLFFIALFFGSATPANAADPRCAVGGDYNKGIRWDVYYNGKLISGGCTCYVANKVWSLRRVEVPNWGSAGSWYGNATWRKGPNKPQANAIAVFSGHVAWVDRVSRDSQAKALLEQPRQERYQSGWTWQWQRSGLLWKLVKVPVYSTRTVGNWRWNVTEIYTVSASQQNYNPQNPNGPVVSSSWKATRTYVEVNGQVTNEKWSTAANGIGYGTFQGYIYP